MLALMAFGCRAAETRFSAELWNGTRPLYARTLRHPFLKGLVDGSLPRARFPYYLVQDSHYLRAFAQALSVLAAKAPREDWSLTLHRHAADALATERKLHQSVLASFGVSPAAVREARVAPTNYAYTNHVLAVAFREPLAYGLAAVLPCYWIYREVGKQLSTERGAQPDRRRAELRLRSASIWLPRPARRKPLKRTGSRNPGYQRWIDQSAGPRYGGAVRDVLAMTDLAATGLDAAGRSALHERFRTSARDESML